MECNDEEFWVDKILIFGQDDKVILGGWIWISYRVSILNMITPVLR